MLGPKAMIVVVFAVMLAALGYIVLTSYQSAEAHDELRADGPAARRVRMMNEAMEETEKVLGD